MSKPIPLSSEELATNIFKDYEGMSFTGYKFKIPNSPTIRVSKENPDYIRSCTCKNHSINGDKPVNKVKCRYTEAYKIYNGNNNIKADSD